MSKPSKSVAAAPAAAPPPAQVATIGGRPSLVNLMAARYSVDAEKLLGTLKATAFRQRGKNGAPAVEVTNEQLMALLVVANEYHLNPFTREIYAFPSENGIVPIISVDGWIRLINERKELESIQFLYADDGEENSWIECTIERKDRSMPIVVREYLSECVRDTGPWKSHPRRMLRHKALIQCARIAFGFAGVYDPDEAERIVATIDQPQQIGKPATEAPRAKAAEPTVTIDCISIDQQTLLRDRLHEEGLELNALLAKFEVGNIEEIPAVSFEAANTWIDETSAA